MPTLFVFLFKVNIALLLFCAGYYLVLRHLTFYSLNRVYLVTAIVFATLYPKIDLSDFAQKHETLTKPVQNVVLIWQKPAEKLATHPDYWQWAEVVFWAGAALLAIRLFIQLFSLQKLYRNSKPANLHNHEVRLMQGDAAPFSFWRSIYVNPANHTPADLKAILLHEQMHVNGWHTLDILLAELSSIFYWFNPGIWLMKRAVRENIEFITDRKILNHGFDSKTYQYSLVNVSFNNSTPGIVNHFNISTIKKRIIMMNAKRSSRFNLTRYAFVVPAVVALLLVFTLSKADVTKPISLKISNAIKPVTAAIKQAAKEVTLTINTQVKKDTTVKSTVTFAATQVVRDDKKGKTDSTFFSFSTTKPDTGKKSTIYIRTNGSGMDSMNFVLNGKKISSTEFRNINPEKISAINIVNNQNLDALLGPDNDYHFDNKKAITFITTSDSEAGKKLAERLGTHRQITNIRVNGVNSNIGATKGLEHVIVSGYPSLNSVEGKPLAFSGRTQNDVVIIAGKPALAIKGQKAATFKGNGSLKNVVVTGYPAYKADTVRFYSNESDVNSMPPLNKITGVRAMNGKSVSIASIHYAGTDVNRISDKLIVIDGKEASETEMKKLSAFDIDRMSISSDADTIKKYGDKAKYGVVYIYTKKGK